MRQMHPILKVNRWLSMRFERLFPQSWRESGASGTGFVDSYLIPGMIVADVGGGKKPFFSAQEKMRLNLTYIGIDIDPEELELAPDGVYDDAWVVNLERPPGRRLATIDLIICRNTLEHVQDARAAFEGLYALLKPGGVCVITSPCRHAMFAKLNKTLPQQLKRNLLQTIFPGKAGDGFIVYYDRASPTEYSKIIQSLGGTIIEIRKFYWSSYFSVFVPAYVLWRLLTICQRLLIAGYCENFQIAFRRNP